MVLSEELSILESCCLRPMMRNSVLEELRVKSKEDLQTSRRRCVSEQSGGGRHLTQSCEDGTRKKVEYHLHKGDG